MGESEWVPILRLLREGAVIKMRGDLVRVFVCLHNNKKDYGLLTRKVPEGV